VTRFDSSQPCYNMLNRAVEAEDLPFCGRHGIGVVCYSPLCQGILTGKYRSVDKPPKGSRMARKTSRHLTRENVARVRKLEAVAKRKRCSMARLALAWVLRRAEVTSVIIGATRPEQVKDNVKAGAVRLTAKDLDEIESILSNAP